MSNEKLAEVSAKEAIEVLTTPINGVPSMKVVDYENSVRLLQTAFLTIWEKGIEIGRASKK